MSVIDIYGVIDFIGYFACFDLKPSLKSPSQKPLLTLQ